MNRLLGVAIILLWGSSLVALFYRDVLPYWQAQDQPIGAAPAGDRQVGIFDKNDRRIGTNWVSIRYQGTTSNWYSLTALSLSTLSLPGLPALPNVLFDTTLNFQADGTLTGFETKVLGMMTPIELKGYLLGIDYSCLARIGSFEQKFSIDAQVSQQLSDNLKPYTHLPRLRVGQSWQVQVLDPVSLLLQQAARPVRVLVRVAGRDSIEHGGEMIECFRVESDLAVAWVHEDGRVLKQVVYNIPLMGKITLLDEPFDAAARAAARRDLQQREPEIMQPANQGRS